MANQSAFELDLEALRFITEEAWEMVDQLPGVPASQQGQLASSVIVVLGQAYIQDRARYRKPQ